MKINHLAAMILWAIGSSYAYADQRDAIPADDKAIMSFALENDIFAGEDNGYTNGVRASYLSPETDIPEWIDFLADHFPPFANEGRRRYAFALGQSMHTPDDITNPNLIVDDRPYAGFLYGSVGLISDQGDRLDNLQLTLGVVGPSSKAGQTQDFVHHQINSPDPQGWDHQLEDEPAFILTYERKWRLENTWEPLGLQMDMSPHLGVSLGNIHTHAAAGATFRLGYDLPADYGPPLIRPNLPGSDFFQPTEDLGGYIFAGFEARAVARNIFLDGNSFKNSHSVNKHPFVGSIQAGIAMTWKDMRLAYTHIFRTKEFEGQKSADEFGVLTLSTRF